MTLFSITHCISKAPNADEQLQIEHYKRTKEMDMELGLQVRIFLYENRA